MLLQLPPRDEDILSVEFSRESTVFDAAGDYAHEYVQTPGWVEGVMRFTDDRFEHPPEYGDEFYWREMRWLIVEVEWKALTPPPQRTYTAQLVDAFNVTALQNNPLPQSVV